MGPVGQRLPEAGVWIIAQGRDCFQRHVAGAERPRRESQRAFAACAAVGRRRAATEPGGCGIVLRERRADEGGDDGPPTIAGIASALRMKCTMGSLKKRVFLMRLRVGARGTAGGRWDWVNRANQWGRYRKESSRQPLQIDGGGGQLGLNTHVREPRR